MSNTRTLPLHDFVQRYTTAVDDLAALRRVHAWALAMYGVGHARVAQAQAELALALLALVVERGKKSITCRSLMQRPIGIEELEILAKPALDGVYGLTVVEIRKALLPERRAERQAERRAAEAEDRRRRERQERRMQA